MSNAKIEIEIAGKADGAVEAMTEARRALEKLIEQTKAGGGDTAALEKQLASLRQESARKWTTEYARGLQDAIDQERAAGRETKALEERLTALKAAGRNVDVLGKQGESAADGMEKLNRAGGAASRIFNGIERASEGGTNGLLGLADAIRGVISAVASGLGPAGIVAAAAGVVLGLALAFKDKLFPAAKQSEEKMQDVARAAADLDRLKLAGIRAEFELLNGAIDREKAKLIDVLEMHGRIERAALDAQKAQVNLQESRGEISHEQAANARADIEGRVRAAGETDIVKRAAIENQSAQTKKTVAEGQLSAAQTRVADASASFDVAAFDEKIARLKLLQEQRGRLEDTLKNDEKIAALGPAEQEAVRDFIKTKIDGLKKEEDSIALTDEQKKTRQRLLDLEKDEAEASERFKKAANDAADAQEALANAVVEQARLAAIGNKKAKAEAEISRGAASAAASDHPGERPQETAGSSRQQQRDRIEEEQAYTEARQAAIEGLPPARRASFERFNARAQREEANAARERSGVPNEAAARRADEAAAAARADAENLLGDFAPKSPGRALEGGGPAAIAGLSPTKRDSIDRFNARAVREEANAARELSGAPNFDAAQRATQAAEAAWAEAARLSGEQKQKGTGGSGSSGSQPPEQQDDASKKLIAVLEKLAVATSRLVAQLQRFEAL